MAGPEGKTTGERSDKRKDEQDVYRTRFVPMLDRMHAIQDGRRAG